MYTKENSSPFHPTCNKIWEISKNARQLGLCGSFYRTRMRWGNCKSVRCFYSDFYTLLSTCIYTDCANLLVLHCSRTEAAFCWFSISLLPTFNPKQPQSRHSCSLMSTKPRLFPLFNTFTLKEFFLRSYSCPAFIPADLYICWIIWWGGEMVRPQSFINQFILYFIDIIHIISWTSINTYFGILILLGK